MKKVSMASLVSGLFVLALCLVLPLSAFAVDKLIVKDAGGVNTVFVVNDSGQVGARTASPQASLHVVDTVSTAARGIISAQYSDNITGAVVVVRKGRGTEAIPATVLAGDYLGALNTQGYDGSGYQTPVSMAAQVEGPVGAGFLPTSLVFNIGSSTVNKPERMRITSAGKVIVKDLAGTYAGGSAYVCVNNSGQLFKSETACP